MIEQGESLGEHLTIKHRFVSEEMSFSKEHSSAMSKLGLSLFECPVCKAIVADREKHWVESKACMDTFIYEMLQQAQISLSSTLRESLSDERAREDSTFGTSQVST